MKKNDYVKAGRLLCYVLRHDPQYFNLEMDTQGWVKTTNLISAINASDKKLKFQLTFEILLDIAEQDKKNDKDRYEFKNYKFYHFSCLIDQYKTYRNLPLKYLFPMKLKY